MTTYYDVTLGAAIARGSDIQDKPCTVVFTYKGGSHSATYTGTVIAWFTSTTVRISSATMNIEAAWVDATGGTLTIQAGGGALALPITGFVKN